MNPLAATNEVHVPAFVVEILDKKTAQWLLGFYEKGNAKAPPDRRYHVDSEVLEA